MSNLLAKQQQEKQQVIDSRVKLEHQKQVLNGQISELSEGAEKQKKNQEQIRRDLEEKINQARNRINQKNKEISDVKSKQPTGTTSKVSAQIKDATNETDQLNSSIKKV